MLAIGAVAAARDASANLRWLEKGAIYTISKDLRQMID